MSPAVQAIPALPANVPVVAPAILGSLIAALAAVVVLAYSWRRTREPWIAWLAAAWVLWITRYVLALMPDVTWPLDDPRQSVVLFGRDAALVMALRHLGARWFAPVWGIAALVALIAAFVVPSGSWYDWYASLVLGSVWLVAGAAVVRSPRLWARVRLPTAIGFWLYAVIIGSTPWRGNAGPLIGVAIALATAVHLIVASGVAVGVHQRMLDEREAAEQRVARALEFVVRGIVPMCAYCRSVRDRHDAWVSLEQFVAQGTAGPVREVKCPDCRASAAAPS